MSKTIKNISAIFTVSACAFIACPSFAHATKLLCEIENRQKFEIEFDQRGWSATITADKKGSVTSKVEKSSTGQLRIRLNRETNDSEESWLILKSTNGGEATFINKKIEWGEWTETPNTQQMSGFKIGNVPKEIALRAYCADFIADPIGHMKNYFK